MRHTPLEQAIARVTDRRRRHDQALRERGLVRVTVTVPADRADELRDVADTMRREAAGMTLKQIMAAYDE